MNQRRSRSLIRMSDFPTKSKYSYQILQIETRNIVSFLLDVLYNLKWGCTNNRESQWLFLELLMNEFYFYFFINETEIESFFNLATLLFIDMLYISINIMAIFHKFPILHIQSSLQPIKPTADHPQSINWNPKRTKHATTAILTYWNQGISFLIYLAITCGWPL